jgi:purine-nucleoside phosphorylase
MADGTLPGLQPGLLTARKMLDWRRSTGRLGQIHVPAGVILTHQASLFKALTPRFGGSRQRGLFCELYVTGRGRRSLGIAGNFGVGGAPTAVVVEELAAVGVQQIVSVDLAASLYADVPSGTIILVSDAVCEDGTSKHYVPEELSGRLASALANRDIGFAAGRVWSTDAPYRETAQEVLKYRSRDAVLVDMETAAFLAAGSALGVETASLLVAADTLYDDWQPPYDGRRIQVALRIAARAARECLRA